MKLLGIREFIYQWEHLRQVRQVTLDPGGPGVVRIHLVPPKPGLDKSIPSAVIINGQDILPLNFSWAVLLAEFIDEVYLYENKEIQPADWETIVGNTVGKVRKVYPRTGAKLLKEDLWTIINTLSDIAGGRKPAADIGLLSIGEYAQHMQAPHRMDLMISSLTKDGDWHCNQRCLHCYAAGQPYADTPELSTREWQTIIRKCRAAGIPQLTFTGGEPTLRDDLVELVDSAQWFITRLNTNGVRLTAELCRQLCQASLDSVQITLYSADPAKHNLLVGAGNWDKTVEGIRNAVQANLSVSINTPLCSINQDYPETLRLIKELGVRYVSCSGLIPAGNAAGADSVSTRLGADELERILRQALAYGQENQIDIGFTSPGWLPEAKLRDIGLTSIPTCGACLSNMAVAPDGNIMPCQSWLSDDSLGNMLTVPWRRIWQNRQCRAIRNNAGKMEQQCLLRSEQQDLAGTEEPAK
jgi:MoaA/NifB/PqqE/SkfB family radical SAM enzyme